MVVKQRILTFLIVLATLSIGWTQSAHAQTKFSFIRDTEIEITIRKLSTPIFQQAGLNPSSVNLYIFNNPALNAFVSGGQNIYLFTGLLMRVENVGQLVGVIAHETGHISGGHLIKSKDAQRNAQTQAIIGALLGGAAAIGGRGDVGAAIGQGAAQIAGRGLLGFSRTQEAAADQSAVRYMDGAGYSAKGLTEFLNILGAQDLVSPERRDAYAQTHPLSQDRIDFLENQVRQAQNFGRDVTPEMTQEFERSRAKLEAYLFTPSRTLRKYPLTDTSVTARYARAIATFRRPDIDSAVQQMDQLIEASPNDPYFQELKGQMLFESGRIQDALNPLKRASELLPNAPLIRVLLAQVQLALTEPGATDPALAAAAIENLRAALAVERGHAFAWRQLGIAYGRNNQMGLSSWALAEEALLRNQLTNASGLAERAKRTLSRGSPEWLRAEDIIVAAREQRSNR